MFIPEASPGLALDVNERAADLLELETLGHAQQRLRRADAEISGSGHALGKQRHGLAHRRRRKIDEHVAAQHDVAAGARLDLGAVAQIDDAPRPHPAVQRRVDLPFVAPPREVALAHVLRQRPERALSIAAAARPLDRRRAAVAGVQLDVGAIEPADSASSSIAIVSGSSPLAQGIDQMRIGPAARLASSGTITVGHRLQLIDFPPEVRLGHAQRIQDPSPFSRRRGVVLQRSSSSPERTETLRR